MQGHSLTLDRKHFSMITVNARDPLISFPLSTVQLLTLEATMILIPPRHPNLDDEEGRLLPGVKESPKLPTSVSRRLACFFSYYVALGNNGALVSSLMAQRKRWVQSDKPMVSTNLRWTQSSKSLRFELLNHAGKKAYNHLEFHEELTTKNGLLRNMRRLCAARGSRVYERVPVSFEVSLGSGNQDTELSVFLKFFLKNTPGRRLTREQRRIRV
jgi:hypothetical protein